MTDGQLIVFGSAVTFMAIAGAYIYLRADFLKDAEAIEKQAHPPVNQGHNPVPAYEKQGHA